MRAVPTPCLGPGQVLIAVEESPVHPADLAFIRGAYRVKPRCPQVAGLSGVGHVVRAGDGVALRPGTRVAFRAPGAWAQLVAVPVDRVYEVPSTVDMGAAAQLPLNPITAWGLLASAHVRRGDFLGLTAASSSVAALVGVLARERGIHVGGIAREGGAPGPEQILADSTPQLAARVRERTGGRGLAALLDCVGGPLVESLFPAMAAGATVVAYGTLSPDAIAVQNATLVYGNLTWFGFGIDRFLASLSPAGHQRMLSRLWAAIAGGRLPLPLRGRVPLDDFPRGLALARQRGPGKVHFAPVP